ncbi:6726_t:CDS:2 [Paraglomus occultum]|uniref:6726_t:CDS:1 n=1 Tax=Paraglomus occultum TaxID=144539 RepID=A0A9N8YZZ7_9GLOM|nr:6726_t:CDS:2 [Paraglomus occultum]
MTFCEDLSSPDTYIGDENCSVFVSSENNDLKIHDRNNYEHDNNEAGGRYGWKSIGSIDFINIGGCDVLVLPSVLKRLLR